MTIRDELVCEVRKYLVGPRKEDEVIPGIPNFPLDYYISGILFPKNSELDMQDKDSLEKGKGTDGEKTSDSEETNGFLKQNSIGLRVNIKPEINSVLLEIDYGKYEWDDELLKWKRIPIAKNNRHHKLDLQKKEGRIEINYPKSTSESIITWNLDEGDSKERYRVLTVFLENSKNWKPHEKGKTVFEEVRIENNQNSIFQPLIRIISETEQSPFQTQETSFKGGFETSEDKSLNMLYRKTNVFGIGYNCAVEWEKDDEPLRVNTVIFPSFTARAIAKESEEKNDKRPEHVDMFELAYAIKEDGLVDRNKIKDVLEPTVKGYEKWIKSLDDEIKKIKNEDYPESHFKAAKDNQERCYDAYKRILSGWNMLYDKKTPEKIVKAFVLANRAMLYQRQHYEYALKKSKSNSSSLPKPNPKKPGQEFWYPFQIAFFLMSLEGIIDNKSPDRKTVDLLWFPTGGGKTEAYMGVTAFAILLRRLNGDGETGDGVTVIMRYTLRLLTLQQFERASSLMCALEFIRRTDPKLGLGNWPFLVGLWVGWSLTPNSWNQSYDVLKALKSDSSADTSEGSPVQLFFCPWCGNKITHWDYGINPKTHWTIVHCNNNDCFFHSNDAVETKKALPVVTVDTDIYRRCPAIVIATVDKLARMPYRPEISSIFGKAERFCQRDGFLAGGDSCGVKSKHDKGGEKILNLEEMPGPDIIIQDELHLISGPLGTMVGLYENAVDYLTRRFDGAIEIKPKIIASTATIRGVDDQIMKLFNRNPPQKFPPPGVIKNDSYFWWESKKEGRQYVGVSFSNFSAKFAIARLLASLLQKVKDLSNSYTPKEIDPYWSLVAYFNSIRELGGAIRLIEEDVVKEISNITSLIEEYKNDENRDPGKPNQGMEELTGRIKQGGIRRIREKLEKSHEDRESISTLLATNMISVGIDIERLGLMTVVGQTKNSSEYIQATGRIGRRADIPGLIFTFFNPYKPRDLSHYENFSGFHKTMQKSLESSSLTPFSVRALDRALHAVFIAMVRLSIPRFAVRETANDFEADDPDILEIKEFILDRFMSIEHVDDKSNEYASLKEKLDLIIESWDKYIGECEENPKGVWYNNPSGPDIYHNQKVNKNILMIEFAKKPDESNQKFPIATPESLRNVEKEIPLKYI